MPQALRPVMPRLARDVAQPRAGVECDAHQHPGWWLAGKLQLAIIK
jgi:hypothetical protein